MGNRIKFIAFYSSEIIGIENRQSALSAKNKIDYICNTLVNLNYKVDIISPSWTNHKNGVFKGQHFEISNNIRLKTFNTFGANNRLTRLLKYIYSLYQLTIYLMKETKDRETIIVYHSTMLTIPIKIINLIKHANIVLEVEEIYQDIQNLSGFMRLSENMAFKNANKYILSTELLNKKINTASRPYTIIYGTYQVEDDRKCKFNDEKIHVVYAGTFDPRKGGALGAAASAAYLPPNYHVHILGFGSGDETDTLKQKIGQLSQLGGATVTFDGLLSGEEYIVFLQKCDIGLSTQLPNATYNESSFPSKILSYMANGLRVVTIRIKAIEISEMGHALYYYDEPNPEAIANAILSIDMNKKYDSRHIISGLNESFTENIRELLALSND